MRKLVLAIVALLSLPSAGFAAFWQGQTYAGPPQITFNILSPPGGVTPAATCSGDAQAVTRTVTITSGVGGFKYMNVTVNTFSTSPSDAGKTIVIPNAGPGGNTPLVTTIASVTDQQNVVLTLAASTPPSGVSLQFGFGTDDAAAFKAFNTWAVANQGSSNQVLLTIPNGSNCWFGSQQGYSVAGTNLFNYFAANINNIIVEGTGATLNSIGGFGFGLGARGVCQAGIASVSGCSARIDSVSSGASQVALTSASFGSGYISRFTVNKFILIGGLSPQSVKSGGGGGTGFPPGLHLFEWRQITAVNTGTGVITLDRPLTNSYLDTWPLYDPGNNNEADEGGPATIWTVADAWNTTQEYRGLTMLQTGQINGNGRTMRFLNVTFPGTLGNIPSQNETWTATNTTWPLLTMEVDKLIGTMTMDGVTIKNVQFQSSSTNSFILKNSTITGSLQGGGKTTTITDTAISSWTPGVYSYGATTGPTTCTRCNVTTFSGEGGLTIPAPTFFSMSGGVISYLNSDETGTNGPPGRIFIPPNGNIFYQIGGSFSGSIGLFNVQGLTQDPTNTFVQTNEAGGFPPLAGYSGIISSHAAPQWTCDTPDPASDPTFSAMCVQSGATPLAPMGQFSKRSYTPSSQSSIGSLISRGRLVSLTVDVTTASTHTGSITVNPTAQSVQETVKQSDWTTFNWLPVINLKVLGTRVFTPAGGWTCNGVAGGCSGDTVTGAGLAPEAVWIKKALTPFAGGTFSGGVNPTFSITIQTNQGVVP